MNRGEKWIVKLRQSSGSEDTKELTGEDLRGILGISVRSNSPQKEAERGYNLGRCRDTRCNFEETTPRFGYFLM
jgi:hypothetical protein